MNVYLPDGSALELPDGASGADAAARIGAGLARAALAVQMDGETQDLNAPLRDGAAIEIVTERSPEALPLIRHDAAHVLATAVLDLWPETKVSIGPPIADGFYYDFEFPPDVAVGEDDLPRIEELMAEHVAADEPFERRELPAGEALELFRAQGQDYKVELISDLVRDEGAESVSLYRNGPFEDLCRGPHAPSTGRIGAFALTAVAGAYWRGDESRQQLTRIYGTAFFSERELAEHRHRLEQARARDHRRLGRELDLFLLSPEAPGMPFWLPRGMAIVHEVEAVVREQLRKRGYEEIRTPHVLDTELWRRSGHWDNYRENMYFTQVDDRDFAIKPMNCPGACLVYGSRRRSYRELPVRLAEFGQVTRFEREGVLHGLLRVRAFVQDDAHVYCTPAQIADEVVDICESIDELYATFGFEEVRVELSTRPERSIGTDEQWQQAEGALGEALARQGRAHQVNEGDGAFYGPKIDFHITDAIGRSWQCGTCQLDFSMPERFGLTYTGADDAVHVPVLIHRALLGSVERFVGVLTEHWGGRFPLWLAPEQVCVLPIADRHASYADSVGDSLRGEGLRVEVDARSESVGRRIRDAELRKVPVMLVVGDSEEQEGTVSVRRHGVEGQEALTLPDLGARLGAETEARSAPPDAGPEPR